MKGTLKLTPNGYVVAYVDSDQPDFIATNKKYQVTVQSKELPVHPSQTQDTDKNNTFTLFDGRPVDFTIKEEYQEPPDTIHCNRGDYVKYALIIEPEDTTSKWDEIFEYIEDIIHVPLPNRLKNWLQNTFYPPVKRNKTWDKKVPFTNDMELCECGKMATYCYMPGYSGGDNPYHCSDCVPRGCTCNYRFVEFHEVPDGEEGKDWKWIEEGRIWVDIDEQGREYPCAEHMWDPDGFEKD